MAKVSIIVPSYNHARFIPACVESVLAQTFEDWEMIIVDDGSSDNSVEIWKSYSDPRIQVLKNESNLGTYGTQNRAVSLAKSDLIAVLNSDDFWEPEKLTLQLDLIEKYPDSPFCYTLGKLADENGNLSTDSNYDVWPKTEHIDLLPYLLESNRIHASSVIWRRKWAEFEPDFNETGDWIASLRAAHSSPVICVTESLSHWRIHGANTSSKMRNVTKAEIQIRTSIVRNRDRWFLPRLDPALVRDRVGKCAFHLSALEMLWGNVIESRKNAKLALRLMDDKALAFRRLVLCYSPRAIALGRFFPDFDSEIDSKEVADLAEIPWNLTEPNRE